MHQSYCHQLDVPAFLRKYECGPDWLNQAHQNSFCYQEDDFESPYEEQLVEINALDEALSETIGDNPFIQDQDWLNIPTFLRKASTEALYENDIHANRLNRAEDDVDHLIEVLKFRSQNDLPWPKSITELYLSGISEQTCDFLKQYLQDNGELSEETVCELFIYVVTD